MRGLVVICSVSALMLAACISPAPSPLRGPLPTTAGGAQGLDYTLESGAGPEDLRVSVDRLPTYGEASAIVMDLQRTHQYRDDGYFVRINCSTGGTTSVDNRLANGKFAVGSIGAARTGLADGDFEIVLVNGALCPVAVQPPPPAPGGITAADVLAAFAAAALPARNPRDNTATMCPDVGCSQLITTDDVSVYQFPDVATAQRWETALGSTSYRGASIVLRFNGDDVLNSEYEQILADLTR